jgi:hypothetical protein
MTKTRILAAAAVVFAIIPIAVGAALREAPSVAPQPATEAPQPPAEINFDERWISIEKGDRLPFPTPTPTSTPFAVAAVQSDVAPPVASPPEQLPLATEDDLKQAEEEHHRRSDICRRGRTYFTIQHHEYWRCNK